MSYSVAVVLIGFLLLPIGALIGAPLTGWLTDHIGRKNSLLLSTLPFAIGWAITIVSHSLSSSQATEARVLLFTGRFLVGIGVGSTSVCVPVRITAT